MFLSARKCNPDNDNKIGLTSLFNTYREYCKDNSLKPETRENFKMKLKNEGYVVEEDNKKGVRIGITGVQRVPAEAAFGEGTAICGADRPAP